MIEIAVEPGIESLPFTSIQGSMGPLPPVCCHNQNIQTLSRSVSSFGHPSACEGVQAYFCGEQRRSAAANHRPTSEFADIVNSIGNDSGSAISRKFRNASMIVSWHDCKQDNCPCGVQGTATDSRLLLVWSTIGVKMDEVDRNDISNDNGEGGSLLFARMVHCLFCQRSGCPDQLHSGTTTTATNIGDYDHDHDHKYNGSLVTIFPFLGDSIVRIIVNRLPDLLVLVFSD